MYEEYAVLTAQIKELTAQKDAIKVSILEELEDNSIDTAVGKFSVTKLKTWTYTDSVVQMAEDLKATKAQEESTGDATFVEKASLRFNPIKL